ncbi:Gfo/Idh/MocA family oxidoreductase [Vibrio sp. ZSDE26]|uniref:Gfo/Idh/MocA family oxidoreductase n=1 Tax=Vibrio amylolyticus TaxID=2847292 RepID=A0A9X1XMI2_9VIBR|nr:Gfo/Idh/MocA family oxidoreductase [Vibrio amylolyticus]MCK6263665.1 Gfo/Idh/MocA family oxidoreductase [Vibrio amylolyticus]
MRIGVIGLGDIALKAYMPILANLKGVELVLCTRNAEVLHAVSEQYRIKEYCLDYHSLPMMNVDAVMIHAATSAHFNIASYFLKQGIATFVDKPLADSAKQVEQLYEYSYSSGAPLYVGFNRRHIPLFNQHIPELKISSVGALTSLRWEKHRHNLPGELRTFIFDDFIHPLDSINLDSRSRLDDLNLTFQKPANRANENELSRLDIQWQAGETILHASMNRSFGVTCENVMACYENKTVKFDSFVDGQVWSNGQKSTISLKDWTPMLTSKGFESMIKDWLEVVQRGSIEQNIIERNIATHRLAESVYQYIVTR